MSTTEKPRSEPRMILHFPRTPQPSGASRAVVRFYVGGSPFYSRFATGDVHIEHGDQVGLEVSNHVPGQMRALLGCAERHAFRRISVLSGELTSDDLAAIGDHRTSEVRFGKERTGIAAPDSGPLTFADGPDLSPLGPLEVLNADHVGFTDDHMSTFRHARGLDMLRLSGASVSPEVLSRFARLRSLYLEGDAFGGDLSFLSHLEVLRVLDIRFSRLTQHQFVDFERCPELVALSIGYNRGIGPDLSGLDGCRNLRYLDISTTAADDLTLESIPGRALFDELIAQRTHLSDAGLGAFERMSALTTLRVGGTRITDRGLARIVECLPNLRVLDIRATDVTRDGSRAVAGLKHLQRLDLSGHLLTIELAELLKEHTDIQEVWPCPPFTNLDEEMEAVDVIGAAQYTVLPV